MMDLADWLKIDVDFYANRSFEVQNASRGYKLAPLHRLSNAINDRAEFALRRRPELKDRLRKMYLRFNGSPTTDGLDSRTRQRLDEIFGASNRETREILERRDYEDFPSWLTRK